VEASSRQHEETVVPVKPGLRAVPAAEPAPLPEPRSGSTFWTIAGGAVLLVMAFGAFVLLPRWMEQRATAAAPQAANEAPVAPEPSKQQLSPQELAALERQADELLAGLLTQQRRLAELRSESWGGEQWQRYSELGAAGDDAYLEKDFQAAVASYSEAMALGDELLDRSVQIVDSALAAAQQAFEAGNAEVAIGQYDLVLGLEPEHEAAKAGRARAERLNEVLELVRRGDEQRRAGELDAALTSYRAALAIDADWEAARTASAAVSGELQDAEFERAMSLGFSALAAEDFAAAGERFTAALQLRPQSREAREGRTQAEEGAKLNEIALAEARALAFERRELWPQAIAQYRAALETDPDLQFAIAGLERSEARLSLEAKLTHLIDNPTLLFSDTVLADSRKLLVEATALEERGPRLTEQIDKLDRLVALAAAPITVELRSDQLTEVTLYRMGPLGVFTTRQVELRPGTYTAIGSRNGYRDVRQSFTVVPGRELPPISVICVEPI
jgi:tetratricopeptide (TPR) repeat protein